MKHSIQSAIVWICAATLCMAGGFEEAMESWRLGDAEKAAMQFGVLCESGHDAACYNLGYIAYQRKQYAEAIYAFRKTLLIHPGHDMATHNLALAQKAAGIEKWELPGLRPDHIADRVVELIPQTIALVLYVVLCTAGLWIWLRPGGPRRLTAGKALVAVSVLFALIAMLGRFRLTGRHTAIIMQESPLHLSPDEASEKKYQFKAGEEVTILDHLGEWAKVRTENYETGWTIEKTLRPLQ